MIVHDFSKHNSIINQYLWEMRDVTVQKDSLRFRKNVERVGELLAYELSKTLKYKTAKVKTPLGEKAVQVPDENIVLCSILRAGLPLHHGILNVFDRVENAFISAYRHHPNGADQFEVQVEYLATPSLEGKTLILADPMMATGRTFENVLRALQTHGTPKQIHLVSIIAAKAGIFLADTVFPKETHLWIAAIDDALNERGYIVPGLGDAGDLCYGPRLD